MEKTRAFRERNREDEEERSATDGEWMSRASRDWQRQKKKQLRHAQYKARQEKMTYHEKQALKERCHAAYQNRKTRVNAAANVQVSTSAGEHKAESSYVPRRSPRIEMQQRELQLENTVKAEMN
ncbi:hypothetical protein MKW98_000863 [Papaver atlanticum]|uniref:Uncharacterized protein n=1 Tax=Papaver atlanticum TaxID=357466 RepID=A0AAD4SE20_9MAGN|nr:hypothetical protein MKW98_000863 [Papaver atlanticum]